MREEDFKNATKRNALRKEAGLPLLDIRKTMEDAHIIRQNKKLAEKYDKHLDVLAAIKRKLCADIFGNIVPLTAGGKFAIDRLANDRYIEYLKHLT